MKCVTVKDFGIALEVKGVTVRQRIVRGKLVKNGYGLIDIEDVTNFSYIVETNGGDLSVFDKYLVTHLNNTNLRKKVSPASKNIKNIIISEKRVITPENLPEKAIKPVLEKPSKIGGSVKVVPSVDTKNSQQEIDFEKPVKLTEKEKKEQREAAITRKSYLDLDLRKKEAEVKLVERNAELRQWELEKKAGNTLPLNMIENVVAINYKAVFKSIHSQIKNIAMVMVQQLGGSKEDLNTILIEMESILDKTVKDSKKKATVDIEKLIEEYSEIRSRGERKV